MPSRFSPNGLAFAMAEWLRKRRGGAEEGGQLDRKAPIHLRQFAGPLVHTEQLGRPIRVVHLTDLHVGRVTPMWIQQGAIALTNAQGPDLVVITGDFVCHSQAYLADLEELMKLIQAPVVGVLGNHDYWSGAREVRHALKKGGVTLLDNAHTTITIGHERLQLVGLDDAYTGHADLPRAVKGLRRDLATIGLSHIAEEADHLWEHGVPIVFSGHTHAGQVTLAGINELLIGHVAGHKYLHGLYGTRSDAAPRGAVYVGAGIGASVVPFRLGERGQREVAVFELGAPPGTHAEHHTEQLPRPGRKPSPRVRARRAAKLQRKQARIERRRRKP